MNQLAVMCDNNDCCSHGHQLLQQVRGFHHVCMVQAACRLIQQQDLTAGGESTGDCQTLLLPTGEALRMSFKKRLQIEFPQNLRCPLFFIFCVLWQTDQPKSITK